MAEPTEDQWLVEEGIGEHRAILVSGGRIIAAQVDWPGSLAVGRIDDAVLVARTAGSKRGTVRFASGEQALVDGLPRDAREGAPLRVIVTRAAIADAGRLKLAQVRPTQDAPCPAPTLAERLQLAGEKVRIVRRFVQDGWNELFAEAWEGCVEFDGGSLLVTPTAAMTVIDIDGTLPPRALALAAVSPLTEAIRRFDLGGSIGIDFPTLADKADRRAVDDALGTALSGWPHERTAMNGFGFVQMKSSGEARSAVESLNKKKVHGRVLHVAFSESQEKKRSTAYSYLY